MTRALATALALLVWLASAAQAEAFLLEVHINGVRSDGLASLRTLPNGCDQMEVSVLRAAGLYAGTEVEACLQHVPGLDYRIDRGAAKIEIFSERLAPEISGRDTSQRVYAPQLTGLIGEYGFSAQRVETNEGVQSNGFGDLSLSLHTKWGRLRDDQIATWDGAGTRVQRLATTLERDFPDNSARLTLGDSFSRAPRWGRLSAFAGVQFGSDFSMDPAQTYRPYRTFQALLREQSQVDVRVNGTLGERTGVAAGFNEIRIIPESGLNDVEIAIRDGAGLTRIEDVSFFAAPDGLAKGTTDYSFSAGVPRRFDGLSSTYGDTLIASGLVRRGISDSVTVEGHGEASQEALTLGSGAQFTAGMIGVLNVSAGVSRREAGRRGHVLAAGLERNTRRASLQLQARIADPDYADAASANAGFPDVSLRASAGLSTLAGSFRTSYTEQSDRTLADRRFVSFGWDKSLDRSRITLSASGFHDLERGESGCAVSLRMSFGGLSVRASRDRFAGLASSGVELARLRQAGDRLQWSVRGATGETGTAAQADLQADLGIADVFAHAGQYGDTREISGGVRGSFTSVDRKWQLARQSTPASVLVHAPGLAGAAIYQDNRIVAVTDTEGMALISGIRPFEVNRVSLLPEGVPLDYSVRSFDLDFIPQRGISAVSFEVKIDETLAFTVHSPGGAPLPAGSHVVLTRSGVVCPVGMDGRVYCASANDGDSVLVTSPEGRFTETVRRLRRGGIVELGPQTELVLAELTQ